MNSTDRITSKLPIDYDLARKIADSAIELFIECRDIYGMDETRARWDAVTTVAEGASTPDDPAADPQPGEPGFNSHTWRQEHQHPQVEHVPHSKPDGSVCWGTTGCTRR